MAGEGGRAPSLKLPKTVKRKDTGKIQWDNHKAIHEAIQSYI